ncbi:Hypothetical protein SRAE_2000482100 [Strongyloides ratti]|uniref:Uncharacterized protein n=1 Tax=Strongyloides ratti TaxID=34506 RepID=A0A090LK97_STRRB|nr:Hypothetical protein SRAE_2000482100 [Strongyloides ratti]CEF70187.1 Hypothetical protein SRAE_2000482100 [Strongyloides ratti]
MDMCIYTTFNVPGYAIGIISGCQKSVEKYLSNIINERKDLANIFHNFINSTSNKIDIPSLCKYTFEIKPFIMFETLTGKSEFFIHCYLQNIIYISPPTSFYPPSSPVIPVTCSDGVKKTICYEGYCGMMEVGYISQSNLSQINITYQSCPNDLVNKVYEISQINDLISNKDFQSKTEDACSHCIAKSSTRILSNSETFSYYLYTNCYDPNIGSIPVLPPFPSLNNQPIYKLLGKVYNSNTTTLPCNNEQDTCTYISLNIPGFVIGYFSGCPENADLLLSGIFALRTDLLAEFKNIFNNNTKIIDHNLLCERSLDGDQPYIINTMTGPGVKYYPPLIDSIPVLCMNDKKISTCSEGYCAMAEIASITLEGKSQNSLQFQYCPNDLINVIYVISKNYNVMFNDALLLNLNNIGPICVDKTSFQSLSKNGSSSYYWYVNCYVPNSTYAPQFPTIPNLMPYVTITTTTTKTIETVTKIASFSNNISIVSLIIFIVIFFYF